MTPAYTTDLTLEQYQLLEPLLPAASVTGRPRRVNLMFVVQAILYVLVSGCAWRLLPKHYPPASTVYYYFRKWRSGWQLETHPRPSRPVGARERESRA